ncbi:MAG: hypothetical protein ACE5GX_19105 [Thermoanaerobaculia bacterium]
MLYAWFHELAHHVAGYLICGDWGYKSFNYFATACEGTRKSWYATYAGPLLSFTAMWVGAWLIAALVPVLSGALSLLLVGPFFGWLEYLMVHRGILDQLYLGIGLLFILNEILTIALFFWTKKWIEPV